MKLCNRILKPLFHLPTLAGLGMLTIPITASAQFSGDLLGQHQTDETNSNGITDYASPAALVEAPKPGELSENLDSHESEATHHQPGFDGGDGPDYIAPKAPAPGNALVGSDAADSIIAQDSLNGGTPIIPSQSDLRPIQSEATHHQPGFDGGDGPDYIAPKAPAPGNALVGSDAADSIGVPDPVDALVGSDAADSFTGWVQISISPGEDPAELSEIHEVTTDLYQLTEFTFDLLSLKGDANEAAISENSKALIENPADEAAITKPVDDRSLSERWEEWILMGLSNDIAELSSLVEDLDILVWDVELGLVSEEQVGAELEVIIENALLIRGFLPEKVSIELVQ